MSEARGQVPFALRAIYIRQSRLHMAENFDPMVPGQALHALFRTNQQFHLISRATETQGGDPDRSAIFVLGFEFRYTRSPEAESPPTQITSSEGSAEDSNLIAEITAEIAVDYQISSEGVPSQDVIQNWATRAAMIHAWPYWREYCHTALLRMGLPVSLMPMLNVASVPPAVAPSSSNVRQGKPPKRKPRRSRTS